MKDKAMEISYSDAISDGELAEIDLLRQELESEGIFCKIDPGTVNGVTARQGGRLVGYMTADGFNGREVEAAALVRSMEVWQAMAQRLAAYVREKGAGQILFVVDPGDIPVTRKMTEMGLTPSHGEYWMELDPAAFRPLPADGVSVRKAGEGDYDVIFRLDRQAFRDDRDDITPRDMANTLIIARDGTPVGKLRVEEADGVHGIYGVVIDRELRDQGIGGKALTLVLQGLLAQKARCIYLEVDFGNDRAFHLYKKLGFKVKKEFRYYPHILPIEKEAGI